MEELRQFPWASIMVLITALSVLSKIVYDYAVTKQVQAEMVKREELADRLKEHKDEIMEDVRTLLDDRGLVARRGGR